MNVLPRPDIAALEGYHSPQLAVSVRLNTNESPYPPPREFVERWLDGLARVPLHRYPDRQATSLRGALGEFHGHDPDRIFVANGSNEVLQTLLLAYGGQGRRAAVFEPTYALHSHIARISGTEIVVGTRQSDFSIDPIQARRLLVESKPSVTFICSPNNPTGTVETGELLDAVIEASPGLIVVDEAYGEFTATSALSRVSDALPLVVVRTYSKVWSMAAVRLGFAIGPRWVIAELEKVVLPYHLSAASLLAGEIALEFAAEMTERVGTLVAERERLASGLDALPGVVAYPSGANFILFRPPGDAHAVWRSLVDRGVLVRDFSAWQGLEGHLRVTVGTSQEVEIFLTALGQVVADTGA